jgi:galactose mutarotase-like enzyme
MHTLTEPTIHSLHSLKLESDQLSLSILPEVGAKILNLIDKHNGKNLLWENPRVLPQKFPIDANFDNYWCGGWDDAFPTADACEYKGEPYPNLGELRSLNWRVEDRGADRNQAWARLSAFAPISAAKATKTVTLRGDQVAMQFELESLGPLPLDFLWGTHPAFAITSETRLLVPAKTGIVSIASHPSLGTQGEKYSWPRLGQLDMSRAQGIDAGVNCGHYLTDLEAGWFAVETAGRGIIFEFPLEECPHLWLWLVYGGWRGYHHAIIEPWTSYPVNLAQAVQQNRHRRLSPGSKFAVTVRCSPYRAPEDASGALARITKPRD